MKKLRSLLLIATILVLPFVSKGQFSREQAMDLVLNQILVSDTGHINLYTSYNTIPNTSNIILLNGQTISPPYLGNWVFFSDDKPFANWDHSCRYIFIDSNTGDFTIYPSTSYPIDLQTSYQAISSINYPCPADCFHNVQTPPPSTFHTLPTNTNPRLHAVLINGIDRFVPGANSCTCNFDYDIALMYNALEEVGYTTHYNPSNNAPHESNVKVLYDNGDLYNAGKTVFHNDWDGPCECSYPSNGSCTACTTYRNEVDFAATDANIYQVFNTLATKLTPEDQLFVYITGNGHLMNNLEAAFECYTPETTPPTPPVYITASQLQNAVKNINCAQIIFVLQLNYSGKFINDLTDITNAQCKNRLVFTSTGDGSIDFPSTDSYKEIWMHCGNIDEFTYYFTAALRGHYQSRYPWDWLCPTGEFQFNDPVLGIDWDADGCFNDPQHPSDYNPDSDNDGYIQIIEDFNYAKYMDTWCEEGYLNQRQIMHPLPPLPDPWPTNVDCVNDKETPMMGTSNEFSLSNLMCLNGIAGASRVFRDHRQLQVIVATY